MKRRNLEDEMDLTQESVRDLTGWCIQIALHQCFGVGRQRMQEQEKTFAKRVILQEVGRRRQSRTPGVALLGDAALRQKFEAAREETFRGTMALRRK